MTATAYSALVKDASTGIATTGPPMPVTPLARKPTKTATTTTRIWLGSIRIKVNIFE